VPANEVALKGKAAAICRHLQWVHRRMASGPQDGRWYWVAARSALLGTDFANTPREAALEAERVFHRGCGSQSCTPQAIG
jgi:hypothetical protein